MTERRASARLPAPDAAAVRVLTQHERRDGAPGDSVRLHLSAGGSAGMVEGGAGVTAPLAIRAWVDVSSRIAGSMRISEATCSYRRTKGSMVLELRDRPMVDETSKRQDFGTARARRDRMLFARVKHGDRRAREELIERFLPLARSVASRFERSAEPADDLFQVASLGLVKAVDRYDADRGVAFSSYAVPTIAGELKRHFRDRSWTVRPPRAVQELTMRLNALEPRLSRELDRAPTVDELATACGATDEQVLEALQARRVRTGLSLQAPAGAEDRQELQDVLGASDDGFAQAEHRADLGEMLGYLSPRRAFVLRLRFEQDLTQAEIGAALGVSQMQVSRIIRAAIEQLREIAEQQQRMVARAPGRIGEEPAPGVRRQTVRASAPVLPGGAPA